MENIGFEVQEIKLGEAIVKGSSGTDFITLKESLEENGFELIVNKKARAIEKVKNVVVELIHQGEDQSINVN